MPSMTEIGGGSSGEGGREQETGSRADHRLLGRVGRRIRPASRKKLFLIFKKYPGQSLLHC